MKKALLVGILGMGVSVFAQENKSEHHIYLKSGANILAGYSNKYEVKDGNKKVNLTKGYPAGFGYSLALETTQNINEKVELGLGIAYQGHNKFKGYSFNENGEKAHSVLGKYDSVPVYFIGKYNFNTDNEWKPFVKGNLGYSFNINEKDTKLTVDNATATFKTKVDNGLYIGLGGGVEYKNFLIDLSYTINYGKAKLISKDKLEGTKVSTDKNPLVFGALTLSVGYRFDM